MSDVTFILVYVDDVAASEAFYASILGRGAIESSSTFAMLPAAPGVMLGLWKRSGVQPPASVSGGIEIAFAAADETEVDELCAKWRALGVKLVQATTRMDFGYTFVGIDPDGTRLRVFTSAAN